jgi:hypothetical protein
MIASPASLGWLGPVGAAVWPLGLDSATLTAFLVAVAVATFLWGFERYRTSFSKREFLVASALAAGIFVAGVFPNAFAVVGSVLNVTRRSLVVSLVANTVLTFLVLYLLAQVRANQLSIADLARSLTVDQAAADAGTAEEPTVAIVIPAYNEAESIRGVVDSLPETIRGHAVRPIVVSDGSTDGTVERAATAAPTVVEHPVNQGQGGALKTGFEIAQRSGADVVVTMDADGQHLPEHLDALGAPVVDDEADYVVGSRYAGVDDSGNSPTRRVGIRVFTALINAMTKAKVTDCTNGFRAIRGSKLDELTLTEERFSAPELLIEARKNGLRIEEVPITVARREAGETKKPRLGYAVGLARTIFTTWIR